MRCTHSGYGVDVGLGFDELLHLVRVALDTRDKEILILKVEAGKRPE